MNGRIEKNLFLHLKPHCYVVNKKSFTRLTIHPLNLNSNHHHSQMFTYKKLS